MNHAESASAAPAGGVVSTETMLVVERTVGSSDAGQHSAQQWAEGVKKKDPSADPDTAMVLRLKQLAGR